MLQTKIIYILDIISQEKFDKPPPQKKIQKLQLHTAT